MSITPFFSFKLFTSATILAAFLCTSSTFAVTSNVLGVNKITINAGNSPNSYTVNALAVPLLQTVPESFQGRSVGTITSVQPSALMVDDADWLPDSMADRTSPYFIKMTSGAAEGTILLISGNTSNSLTISLDDPAAGAVNEIGISAGDSFMIHPCDTLLSLLGTPSEEGIIGGTSIRQSDQVLINQKGNWVTYYYDTSLDRWTEVALGRPDATNIPIRPDIGLLYNRIGNTGFDLFITGMVPFTKNSSPVQSGGVSLITSGWPVTTTLSQLELEKLPGWISNSTLKTSDRIMLMTPVGWKTFWHNGTSWREVALGAPDASAQPIHPESSVIVYRMGTPDSLSYHSFPMPYNLDN